MIRRGFERVVGSHQTLLIGGGSERVGLVLPPGPEYEILGVCDHDCADLNLSLFQGGERLQTDSRLGNWPSISVPPSEERGYQVEVELKRCSTSNCGYQLSVWRRGEATKSPVCFSTGISQWCYQLAQELAYQSEELIERGFRRVAISSPRIIDAGREETRGFRLSPGRTYQILGICDDDCDHLGLSLTRGGVEISRGRADEWPLIELTPSADDHLQMRVQMDGCVTERCGYQLSVWRR